MGRGGGARFAFRLGPRYHRTPISRGSHAEHGERGVSASADPPHPRMPSWPSTLAGRSGRPEPAQRRASDCDRRTRERKKGMTVSRRWLVLPVSLVALIALGMPPSYADHDTRGDENIKNIEWVADIENGNDPTLVDNPINSDMAFWGDLAFQGNFQGFQIHDISDPANPTTLVDYEQCAGGQGDVIIWEDLLVRTWDAPASDT